MGELIVYCIVTSRCYNGTIKNCTHAKRRAQEIGPASLRYFSAFYLAMSGRSIICEMFEFPTWEFREAAGDTLEFPTWEFSQAINVTLQRLCG